MFMLNILAYFSRLLRPFSSETQKSSFIWLFTHTSFFRCRKKYVDKKNHLSTSRSCLRRTVARNKFVAQYRKLRKMLHVKIALPFSNSLVYEEKNVVKGKAIKCSGRLKSYQGTSGNASLTKNNFWLRRRLWEAKLWFIWFSCVIKRWVLL